MKRIAIITPGIMPVPATYGGAVEVLIQHFIENNETEKLAEIDLYTIYDSNAEKQHYINSNIVFVRQNSLSKACYRAINKVCRIFGKKRLNYYSKYVGKEMKSKTYDWVLVENSPHLFRHICEHTQFSNKMLFHMHNNIDRNRTQESCEYVVKHSKCVMVVSEYLKNHLNDHVPNCITEVLYNCVDDVRFSCDGTLRKSCRKKYGFSEGDTVFLYSGRVNSDKGVRELVVAFKEVAKKSDNAKLMVVGDSWFGKVNRDSYTQNVKEIAEEISEKIIFTGYVLPRDMPEIYNAADVVVIPSIWEEPFGVVGLEAMSAKKAIIATKAGGLIEFLDDSCSIMIDRNNFHDEMVAGMCKLASDEELRDNYGRKAYEKLKAHPEFLSRNYLKGLLRIIDKL